MSFDIDYGIQMCTICYRGSFNQGFFPTTVPTKINTWGRGGPVYGPQMWEEEGSMSGSSDDRKDRHYRQRRDFDNTRNGEMYSKL